jgi:hypothetical protein
MARMTFRRVLFPTSTGPVEGTGTLLTDIVLSLSDPVAVAARWEAVPGS